jgi:hypothetical protein
METLVLRRFDRRAFVFDWRAGVWRATEMQ